MIRWWIGVALIAGWLAQGSVAFAQFVPSPVGAARMPEPVAVAPSAMLPPGPPAYPDGPSFPGFNGVPEDPLSLPANHSGAFQWNDYEPDTGIYFHIGPMFLQRQGLGTGTIVLGEPIAPGTPDSGNVPPENGIPLQTFNSLVMKPNFGIRGSIGSYWNGQALEFAGMHLFQKSETIRTVSSGTLDTFFFNAPNQFFGNRGLFQQADVVQTTYKSQLSSPEVNYRVSNQAVWETELILGLRYFDVQEQLDIFVDDDIVTSPSRIEEFNQFRRANYTTRTRNRIVGPQLGMEYSHQIFTWLSFNGIAKGTLGPNFTEIQTRLVRGDGLLGFQTKRYETTWLGQGYDLSANLDFYMLERCRLRLGYNLFWLVGVSEATDVYQPDLSKQEGRRDIQDGSIFWHGPSLEFQFFF